METRNDRTIGLIGNDGAEKLKNASVLLFGVGGVGGHAAEALVRAGVGSLTLVDGDVFSQSNLNRQLFATEKTVGLDKVEAARGRLLEIDCSAEIIAEKLFFAADTPFDFSRYDYIIDAIDTVSSKIEIVRRGAAADVPVISCMGAGNKLDPTAFRVADIYDTKVCPLARIMRKLCRDNGIDSLKVVYSEEEPVVSSRTPASISFVPAAAGLVIASEVVRDLIK